MVPLPSLAILFLKLGALGFGGPAAHVVIMRQEVVARRHWLSDAEFLDLLGAANLIPGPTSTELALHIGFRLGGLLGLLLAGGCFILPSAILVCFLAWLYQTYGTLPQVSAVMRGVKPVVVAIVLDAVRGLAQKSLRSLPMLIVAVVAFVLAAAGMHQLLILVLCGAVVVVLRIGRGTAQVASSFMPVSLLAGGASQVGLLGLFGVFLKIGATVFGSGYVLLAFLQSDLVDHLHWLTSKQLLDAVAVGQITPGPVFTTATFIGFLLAGLNGAVVATIAIFLPGFVLAAASGPLIPRIRKSPIAGAFLDGVTVASIALIGWVLIVLGRATLVDPISVGIAVASFVMLIRFRVNAAWLLAGAALLGAFTR